MRLHLQSCMQFLAPQGRKDTEILEHIHQRTNKMMNEELDCMIQRGIEGIGFVQP